MHWFRELAETQNFLYRKRLTLSDKCVFSYDYFANTIMLNNFVNIGSKKPSLYDCRRLNLSQHEKSSFRFFNCWRKNRIACYDFTPPRNETVLL